MKIVALEGMSLSMLLLQAFLLPLALSQYLPSYPLVSYWVELNEMELEIDLSVGCPIALSVE